MLAQLAFHVLVYFRLLGIAVSLGAPVSHDLEGSRCEPTPAKRFEILDSLGSQTKYFLYCDEKTRVYLMGSCVESGVWSEQIFDETRQRCVSPLDPPPLGRMMDVPEEDIAEAINTKYHVTAGSGLVGDQCVFNTDCLDYMWCNQGKCACLSTYIDYEYYCYEKASPGDYCLYDTQCDAVWPKATCDTASGTGTCTCPSYAARSVTTRDGVVCIAAASTCPLPFNDIDSGASPGIFAALVSYEGVAESSTSTVPATDSIETCTLSAAETASGSCYSGGGLANDVAEVTGGYYIGDLYDCIPQYDTTNAASSTTSGYCCPNRAFTCMLPVVSEEASSSTSLQTRYYYNSASGSCVTFLFDPTNAVSANSNNFLTKSHCESYCSESCERGRPEYDTTDTSVINDQTPLTCSSTSSCSTYHSCTTIGTTTRCCPTANFICTQAGGLKNNPSNSDAMPTGVCGLEGETCTGDKQYYNPGVPAGSTGDTALASTGSRLAPIKRYYYHSSDLTCKSFTWYRQGGNFNNFASKSECDSYCEQLLCTTGSPLKDETGDNKICSGDSSCPATHYCETNVCCPRKQTVCEMPKQTGSCQNYVQRYYFNSVTRECQPFVYSGCQGNSNNFATKIECSTWCTDAVKKPNCVQGQPATDSDGYYLTCTPGAASTKVCPSNYECYFDGTVYGCCPLKSYVCGGLDKDEGITCSASSTRWYYDVGTTSCLSYTYLGCNGNSNNFATKDLCENYCEIAQCPNGGVAYSVGTTKTICTVTTDCPGGYECTTVSTGQYTTMRYCCPTKTSICTQMPYRGTECGSSGVTRYYFNRVTQACRTFTWYGCNSNGNNFANEAQCTDFCESAPCVDGEAVYVNPNTKAVHICNLNRNETCPVGYSCQYDRLTDDNICCGATDMGVCPTGEKAYVDARTLTARPCNPSITGHCPDGFTCRRAGNYNYYCCKSSSGELCPSGRAVYREEESNLARTCNRASVINYCPTGYTCQGGSTITSSGYCCSMDPVCPGGGEYVTDKTTSGPMKCTPGFADSCPSTYTCYNRTLTEGFCCRGGSTDVCVTGSPLLVNDYKFAHMCNVGQSSSCPTGYSCIAYGAEKTGYCCTSGLGNGCPANSVPYLISNVAKTCAKGGYNNCPTDYECVYAIAYNHHQCCSKIKEIPGQYGCPTNMLAYIKDARNKAVTVCDPKQANQCPGLFTCQYSETALRYQCCAENAGCPDYQVAWVDAINGHVRSCDKPNSNTGCPQNFVCKNTTMLTRACCTPMSLGAKIAPTCPNGDYPYLDVFTDMYQACQMNAYINYCPSTYTCQNTDMGPYCCPPYVQSEAQTIGTINAVPIVATQPFIPQTIPQTVPTIPNTQFPSQPQLPTQTQNTILSQTCPTGSNIELNALNQPHTCSENRNICSPGYSCVYSSQQRNYYCCSTGAGSSSFGGSTSTGFGASGGCPMGSPYKYLGSGQSLNCERNRGGCPSGYNCQQSTIDGRWMCCSTGVKQQKMNDDAEPMAKRS